MELVAIVTQGIPVKNALNPKQNCQNNHRCLAYIFFEILMRGIYRHFWPIADSTTSLASARNPVKAKYLRSELVVCQSRKPYTRADKWYSRDKENCVSDIFYVQYISIFTILQILWCYILIIQSV